jgi:hypothetical protein
VKLFTQAILGDPARSDGYNSDGVPGDCWRTAIACITDADSLDDVPHFVHEYKDLNAYGKDWWAGTQEFIQSLYGEHHVLQWWKTPEEAAVPGPMLASGPSPRGDFHHVVIINEDGTLLHDPHPSGLGITSITAVYQVLDLNVEAAA